MFQTKILTYTHIYIFVFKLAVPKYNCIYFALLFWVLLTVVWAQYAYLPRDSSDYKTENMYVDHMVDVVFGEWHAILTLKTHYVDFRFGKNPSKCLVYIAAI